jgi:hypothetical protein
MVHPLTQRLLPSLGILALLLVGIFLGATLGRTPALARQEAASTGARVEGGPSVLKIVSGGKVVATLRVRLATTATPAAKWAAQSDGFAKTGEGAIRLYGGVKIDFPDGPAQAAHIDRVEAQEILIESPKPQ